MLRTILIFGIGSIFCQENLKCNGNILEPDGISSPNLLSRIIGGTEVDIKNWKFAVFLVLDGYECGGSIIAKNWVVTASHCCETVRPQKAFVYTGVNNITDAQMGRELHASYAIKNIFPHPNFQDSHSVSHDFCLIETDMEMDLDGEHADIVCLPEQDEKVPLTEDCYVAGWGWNSLDKETPTETLHKIKVPILTHEECTNTDLSNFNKKNVDEEIEFCAGYLDGSKDACLGDSGGPLICVNENNEPVLWGLVSWGIGCAYQGYPGVYARVSWAITWINEMANKRNEVSTVEPTVSSLIYPTTLFEIIENGTLAAAANTKYFKAIKKNRNHIPKFKKMLLKNLAKLSRVMTVNGKGSYISGKKCGQKSIMSEDYLDLLPELNKKVLVWQNTDFHNEEFIKEHFCDNLKSMLEMVLSYSRYTGWKCRSNGHSSINDITFDGNEIGLKKALSYFSRWTLEKFSCVNFAIYE